MEVNGKAASNIIFALKTTMFINLFYITLIRVVADAGKRKKHDRKKEILPKDKIAQAYSNNNRWR